MSLRCQPITTGWEGILPFIPLFQQREGGRPMAMEEMTEVAEVGILVVGMTRSAVREVGEAMRVGFMVVEPIVIDDISSRKLYTKTI